MPVNNKFYFRVYNEDFKQGGVFSLLDNSEICTLIKLQSNCNGDGIICGINGDGIDLKDISEMVGLNYRTTKKVLRTLEDKDIIKTYRYNGIVILLPFFVYNHTERELYEKKSDAQQRAIQQSIATKQAKKRMDDAIQQGLLRAVNTLSTELRGLREEIKEVNNE